MALPSFSTYAPPFRQRVLGIQMARKREQQCRRREQCAVNAKYFRDQVVRNHFHSEWTSRHSFEQSMAAFCNRKTENDRMSTLDQRRIRLKYMLEEEQKQLDAEMQLVVPQRGASVNKADVQPSLGEERRKKLAQELLKEHRKRNNPELYQVDTASQQHQVDNPLQVQISEKKQQEVEAEKMCHFQHECERTQREDLEKIQQAEEYRNFEECQRAKELHKKMEELYLMEEEATHLKKEEEALQVKLWELDKMDAERRKFEERRKKAQMRNFLIRQYRAQLRRRAQQVQEELESDHKILAALLKGEQEMLRMEGTRRERVFADAAWMNRVIEEQLQLEREREAELDLLHREEAQRVWEKREATWEQERKARELLMHEVLVGRRQQLELKMRKNREAQLESLRSREELIQELELERELRRQEREQEEECRRKEQEEQQLQDQWEEQCRIEELQEEVRKQRIINGTNQLNRHNKPRVVWT
ncbi:trichoplein keratin filament-binding protein [Vanacampus margaritifer]